MKHKYFECDCSSSEHTFRVSYFIDDKGKIEDDLFVSVQLIKQPFLKRLIYSIKYIFGYQCKYGHWDEVILGDKEINRLKILLNNYLERENI